MTDLDAFVGSYPDPLDENIQSRIHEKWEFRELRTGPVESAPGKGKRYKHQELIARLMRHTHDRLFLFHKTGTGKTMAAVAAAEYFRKMRERSVIQRDSDSKVVSDIPMIEKCYIIIKGDAHKEEFKRQILNNAEEGLSDNEKIKNSHSVTQKKRGITSLLKNMGYHFVTYHDIVKMVEECRGANNMETGANIRARYSGCFWILDEVHNIKNNEDGKGQVKYEAIMMMFDNVVRSKILILTATPAVNDVVEIADIINLVRPPGDKIPPKWIKKFKTLSQDLTNPDTVYFIRRYLNGVVSFVRELDIGMEIRRMGIVLPGTQTPVMVSHMATNCVWNEIQPRPIDINEGFYQWDVYWHTAKVYGKKNFTAPIAQAATFVFPGELERMISDEKKDEKMFTKFISLNQDIAKWNPDTGYDMRTLCNIAHLYKYSSKFATIIEVELAAIRRYNPITRGFGPGISFSYSEQKVNTGVHLLGLCIEANGIERFYPTTSVFTQEYVTPQPGEIRGSYKRERVLTIDKRPRYVILTPSPETPSVVYEHIMEVMNSYENRFGEYVMMIIGSKFIREAKSFYNVKRVHKPTPEWNRANDYQAESRAIRSTSHVEAIAEVNHLVKNGVSFTNEEMKAIEPAIEIYNHVSVCPPEVARYLHPDDSSSIDLSRYVLAYEKDVEIKRGERFLKIAAVDYHIHAERNMRATDVSGTPDSDFQDAYYPPLSNPVPKEEVDMSTYEIYYASERIGAYMKIIIEIFSKHFRMQVADLIHECIKRLYENDAYSDGKERLIKRETKFVECAIAQLISEKREIINSFGFISYLQEESDLVFLHSEFSMKEVRSTLAYYTENPMMKLTTHLETYVKETELGIFEGGLYEAIKNLDPESDRFKRLFHNASTKTKIELIEVALVDHLKALNGENNKSPKIIPTLLELYKAFIFSFEEPVVEIEIGRREIAGESTITGEKRGRGRPKNPANVMKIERGEFQNSRHIPFVENSVHHVKGQNVLVHVLDLLSISEAPSRSGDMAHILNVEGIVNGKDAYRPLDIRILKYIPEEGYVWYTANNAPGVQRTDAEHNVYRKMIMRIRMQEDERMRDNFVVYVKKKLGLNLTLEQEEGYKETSIYGSLFRHKGDFRIVMKRDEYIKRQMKGGGKLGQNSVYTGKILKDCDISELIRIAYYLGVDMPPVEYPSKSEIKYEVRSLIWNEPSGMEIEDAALYYIYSAYKRRLTVDGLCALIRSTLEENDLVIYY